MRHKSTDLKRIIMCGIAGIYNKNYQSIKNLEKYLFLMNKIQLHRGPDSMGTWKHPNNHVGFAHRRLKIIDLKTGDQPMIDNYGNCICFNGEIYNYLELKEELVHYDFKTNSDTEVILAAYQKWGIKCVNHFRGMFAFAIWDEKNGHLFCARDRFGIKPFYYTIIDNIFYFASEVKTLLPFSKVEIDYDALKEYLVFQLYLTNKTLFKEISELSPAYTLTVNNNKIELKQYWEVFYELDFDHTEKYFQEKLYFLLEDSVKIHLRSDEPVGAYLSGGIDSSIVSSFASTLQNDRLKAFTGKFDYGPLFDESVYAKALAQKYDIDLYEVSMTSQDFLDTIQKIIYHIDFPVAGPGAFPQFLVSKLASEHRKVVLGGQGGDEIFGGYVRYLIAYFEQCIKGAIEGTLHNGNFIVTYESIIPNLIALNNYKPLLTEFWREGIFEGLDRRYYRLINRFSDFNNEIHWDLLGEYEPFEQFQSIFNKDNVGSNSYFDKMTHFDFKTLLPALLQVEDRMSMAHSLESRVPFLDHPLIEFAATMPSNIKFKNGTLKKILVNSMKHLLPEIIVNRKNKMGFPVPLNEWLNKDLYSFVYDIFNAQSAKDRAFFNTNEILNNLSKEKKFSRKIWGLLSLELWMQEFIDKQWNVNDLKFSTQ